MNLWFSLSSENLRCTPFSNQNVRCTPFRVGFRTKAPAKACTTNVACSRDSSRGIASQPGMAWLAFVVVLASHLALAEDVSSRTSNGAGEPNVTTLTPGDQAATVARVQKAMSSVGILWPSKALPRGTSVSPTPPVAAPAPLPPPGNTAAPVLVETTQSEDVATRLQGLEGLALTGGVEHVDTFVSALADPAPEVRDTSAQILTRLDPVIVSEKVIEALSTGSPEFLARIDSTLPSLKDVLESPMIRVLEAEGEASLRKQAAAYALGRMNSTVAVPVLVARVWQPDPELAVTCANALMALNDPMLMPMLADLARHPLPEIRWAAVQCLAALKDPQALDTLARIAIEPPEQDEELGRQAIVLLGDTRADAAIPPLIEVMRRSLGLRRAAVEALHKITGEDLGDRPSEWQAWYEARQQALLQQQQLPPPDVFGPLPFDIEYAPE